MVWLWEYHCNVYLFVISIGKNKESIAKISSPDFNSDYVSFSSSYSIDTKYAVKATNLQYFHFKISL